MKNVERNHSYDEDIAFLMESQEKPKVLSPGESIDMGEELNDAGGTMT
jgi:hypothetical protein